MKLTVKMLLGAVMWTAAIGGAIGRTATDTPELQIWALLAAALAVLATALAALDMVAENTAKFILRQIEAERAATIERVVSDLAAKDKQTEDRIVSRVQSVNEAALRRVAQEIARTMREDHPTRIR